MEHVEDRLVVLVHKDGHLTTGGTVKAVEDAPKTPGSGIGRWCRLKTVLTFSRLKLLDHVPLDLTRLVVLSVETQPHRRMGGRPVPVAVDVQAPEQLLPALEQRPQRVQKQALAEPAGAGQEIEAAFLHQLPDQ